jgi:hypothetical protein
MATEKLIRASDARRAILKEDPKLAYCIDKVPGVDAVEVVRCKDCAVPHNKWTGCSRLNGLVPPPDFYCAFGKRKDGD